VTVSVAGVREKVVRTAQNPWVRGVAGTAGTRLAVLVVGLASTVALARGLGPTGRGIHALALTIATLGVIVLNLGFHTANTYFASRERETLPTLVSNTVALAVAVALVGVVGLALARVLGFDPRPLPFVLLVLVVAWLPVGLVFIQLQPLLLVVGRLRAYNLAEAGWQLTSVALVVLLWATGHLTPTTAFAVTLAAFVAGALVVTGALGTAWLPRPRPSLRLFRRALPYAGRSYATTVTGFALIRLDILLVENRLGTREVGLYAVAVTIGEALLILPTTIAALLLPKLSPITDEAARWAITRRVMTATAALLVAVCALVAVVANPAIRLLYGADFVASRTPLYWLLPGIVLLGTNAVLIHYFLAVGMPPLIVAAQAAAVALNIGLELVLLRWMGLAGAGLASSVAYGAMFAFTLTYASRWRRRVPNLAGAPA
jgi:O-antigen/teichoic acid export membrane protein